MPDEQPSGHVGVAAVAARSLASAVRSSRCAGWSTPTGASSGRSTTSCGRSRPGVGSFAETLAGVADQLAELAADEDGVARHTSWFEMDDPAVAYRRLTDLMTWLDQVYLQFPDAVLPTCWLWHPSVVEELLWLRRSWLEAFTGRTAAIFRVADWHDRQRPRRGRPDPWPERRSLLARPARARSRARSAAANRSDRRSGDQDGRWWTAAATTALPTRPTTRSPRRSVGGENTRTLGGTGWVGRTPECCSAAPCRSRPTWRTPSCRRPALPSGGTRCGCGVERGLLAGLAVRRAGDPLPDNVAGRHPLARHSARRSPAGRRRRGRGLLPAPVRAHPLLRRGRPDGDLRPARGRRADGCRVGGVAGVVASPPIGVVSPADERATPPADVARDAVAVDRPAAPRRRSRRRQRLPRPPRTATGHPPPGRNRTTPARSCAPSSRPVALHQGRRWDASSAATADGASALSVTSSPSRTRRQTLPRPSPQTPRQNRASPSLTDTQRRRTTDEARPPADALL